METTKKNFLSSSVKKIKTIYSKSQQTFFFFQIYLLNSCILVNVPLVTVILPSCLEILDIKLSDIFQNVPHLLVVRAVWSIPAPNLEENTFEGRLLVRCSNLATEN